MLKMMELSTVFLFTFLHAATLIFGLNRLDFPPEFVFGAGTSAYQVEGTAAEDGRKPSIWDTFTHQGRSYDKRTGDIASDQYHHYKEVVKLMHEMGLDAYRFSMSRSRIIPGDDCISIGDRTSDIRISNINCGPGHGISIGSLGKGGSYVQVENIHVSNVNFYQTTNGVRIKTWQGATGYARDITFK